MMKRHPYVKYLIDALDCEGQDTFGIMSDEYELCTALVYLAQLTEAEPSPRRSAKAAEYWDWIEGLAHEAALRHSEAAAELEAVALDVRGLPAEAVPF